MPAIKFDVLNRFTGAVQFTAEIECAEDAPTSIKLGLAVRWAVKARANLTGANLTDANLTGANLAGANLARANLTGANLTGANLTDANLTGANLAHANLTGAYLTGAYLARANLAGAYLAGAYLTGANLTDANLTGANLTGAYLTGAYLARADLAGANLADRVIDGGIRSDGYRFLLTRTEPGPWRVKAGCRNLTIADAREHWTKTRAGTPLGAETFAILDHMERLATMREWPAEGEPERAETEAA